MNNNPKEVFISYSTKDSEIAFSLLEVLESYGLECWIAPRNIPKGAQWAEEIDKAIQNARVFVVIVSSQSVESKQVPKEIALAVSSCESIFPFRIDDTGLKGTFRYYLSDYQFTDATSDSKQKMIELAEIICSSLGKPIPEQKTEEKPEQTQEAVPPVKTEPAAEEKPEPAANSVPANSAPANSAPTKDAPAKDAPVKNEKAGSKNPIMIGAIAAAVIAVIIGIVFAGKGKKSDVPAEQTASAVQEETQENAAESTPEETQESTPEETQESTPEAAPENAQEETEASTPENAQEETEASTPGSTSAETASEVAIEQNQLTGLVGVWKKVAYEDRGAETKVNTDDLFILADGIPYFSLEGGLSGSAGSALTPAQYLEDGGKYDVTFSVSYEDKFDGSISDKPTSGGFSPTPVTIDAIYGLPDENPTGLTYEECYPERYLFVHMTGTYVESPVKKSDVDTWLVYKKKYPLLGKSMMPALAGKWKDSMGNIWEFKAEGENLTFSMTDTSGNAYNGVEYLHYNANKDKKNFFEHINFKFDKYETGYYSVVSFDGQILEMFDTDWNSFVLTKIE